MSDARWLDAEPDLQKATEHFNNAAALYALGGFDAPALEGYRARMAFLHAMQAAHSSLEGGLLRVLDLLDEEAPSGRHSHTDLIRRVARARPGHRPAILPAGLAEAADETRQFRHVAAHAYDSFQPDKAARAVAAARSLAAELPAALAAFRAALGEA